MGLNWAGVGCYLGEILLFYAVGFIKGFLPQYPLIPGSCATAFSALLVLQGSCPSWTLAPALPGGYQCPGPCAHSWYLCPFLCLLQGRSGALTPSPLDSGAPTSKLPRFYICSCLGPPLLSDWLPAPSPADLHLPVGTTVII